MTAARTFRLPPAGRRVGLTDLAALRGSAAAPAALRAALAARLGAPSVSLHATGREALRVAFRSAAQRTGRREVVVPAYTCFSVAAAAVAAGLAVRLVDVGPEGGIDAGHLATLPLSRAAAVVCCNLFGQAEALAPVAAAAREAGALLVDDAAQALGAASAEGPAGGRGDFGILSFGRGKPLSALGGGALLAKVPLEAPELEAAHEGRWRALLEALAYDVALSPRVFGWLAAVPALGIGETPFDPSFPRAGLSRARAALALAALQRLDADAARRRTAARTLAERLGSETELRPLHAGRLEAGVHPRLACLAPSRAARTAALAALGAAGAGASAMYPSALNEIPGLTPHLAAAPGALPGAAALAGRILTLPTHGGLAGPRLEAALRALREDGA